MKKEDKEKSQSILGVGVIIDSGSSANVIDRPLWEELKKQHVKCVSKRSTKKLYAYGATSPLEVTGTFTADLSLANKCVSTEFTVIQGRGENHSLVENQL